MHETFDCPKCNRRLQRSGETVVEGTPVPLAVFQCDECLSFWEFDGGKFETALTFAVGDDGAPLDPDTLDPLKL